VGIFTLAGRRKKRGLHSTIYLGLSTMYIHKKHLLMDKVEFSCLLHIKHNSRMVLIACKMVALMPAKIRCVSMPLPYIQNIFTIYYNT
jgi:hypothetical protein